jgi:uncharacterized membrane protein
MQRAERSIRVRAPVEQVYQFWRNFENFPQFMEHVQEVRRSQTDPSVSHWKISGPLGTSVEFDARMTRDEPNRLIGWNSIGGDLETSGEVTFTDLVENTAVHVVLQWWDPPGGKAGEIASRLFQNPERMLEEDLRRFKDVVERRVGSGLRQ